MTSKLMKLALLALLLFVTVSGAEIPTLHFDDRVTWKGVFDDGFRPKHLEGLENNRCVSMNQSFWVQFKNREVKFKVENGRVSFSFGYDDFLRMIWHQETEPITLDEGRRRVDAFRKVFEGFIVKEMTMPQLIDPSGLVEAGNAENNIEARIGEYVIWYGFDNSMGKVKPIIPHFYIAWSFPGRPEMRSKGPRDVVRPPKGYEWYSLDPKVNTPDPGMEVSEVSTQSPPSAEASAPPEARQRRTTRQSDPKRELPKPGWILWVLASLVTILGGLVVYLRTRKAS